MSPDEGVAPVTGPASVVPPSAELGELLATLRAFAIPMRTKFRGITVREGALIQGPAGWGEFSPFAEYGPGRVGALAGQRDRVGHGPVAGPVRDFVPVNVTVPAVGPERAYEIVAASGCRTAKVKVAERGQREAEDVERVAAVRDALDAAGPAAGSGSTPTAAGRSRRPRGCCGSSRGTASSTPSSPARRWTNSPSCVELSTFRSRPTSRSARPRTR